MDSREKIGAFVRANTGRDDLRDDEDYFEAGLVSSMFVVQIIAFLERAFHLVIDREDLDFAYFRTINAIDGLVARKLRKGAGV